MSRKNRRSQLRKPQRGSSEAGRAARPAGIPPIPPAQPAPESQVTPPAGPVFAARPLPRTPRGRQQAGPLPPQDAAIPLERVPYFSSDLRRIGLTAGLMFVLLIAGSVVLRSLLGA